MTNLNFKQFTLMTLMFVVQGHIQVHLNELEYGDMPIS